MAERLDGDDSERGVTRREVLGVATAVAVAAAGAGYYYANKSRKKAASTLEIGTLHASAEVILERPESAKLTLTFADYPRLLEVEAPYALVIGEKPKQRVLVWRTPEGGIQALDQRCTHSGCKVQLYSESIFCSCHSSVFAKDGTHESGPAPTSLPSYRITTSDAGIEIDLG